MLGPGFPNDPKQLEDSLYFWGPLNSIERVIVVFYNPDNAERACQASDRYYFTPTAPTPKITLHVFRGAHTVLAPVQLSGPPPDRFYDVESPFHLCPPMPERSFLISPPGSPPVGWEQTPEVPPQRGALAEDLQRALEQLCARQEQEDRDRESTGGASGDTSENEGWDPVDSRRRGKCLLCGYRTGVIAVASSSLVASRAGVHLIRS